MENWKEIKGLEGLYEVSDTGKVRSVPRATLYKDGRIGIHKGRERKQQLNKKGYLAIDLSVKSKQVRKLVHRLVAEAFIPNPDNKEQVNHIDGNKQNNSVDNLEWSTNEENAIHANKHMLKDKTRRAKEVEQYDKEGNLIGTYRSLYNTAKEVNGDAYKISLVCKGKRNFHKNCIWRFKE